MMPPIVPGVKPAPAIERCDDAAPTRQERLALLDNTLAHPSRRAVPDDEVEWWLEHGWLRSNMYAGSGYVIVVQD